MNGGDKTFMAFILCTCLTLVVAVSNWHATERTYIDSGYQKAMVPGCMRATWVAPSELTKLHKNVRLASAE